MQEELIFYIAALQKLFIGISKGIIIVFFRKRIFFSLNILLDDSLKCKLADFGWTKCVEEFMSNKIVEKSAPAAAPASQKKAAAKSTDSDDAAPKAKKAAAGKKK